MTSTTCQNHAAMFMVTEQHLFIEIYGYFKHFIAKEMEMIEEEDMEAAQNWGHEHPP